MDCALQHQYVLYLLHDVGFSWLARQGQSRYRRLHVQRYQYYEYQWNFKDCAETREHIFSVSLWLINVDPRRQVRI